MMVRWCGNNTRHWLRALRHLSDPSYAPNEPQLFLVLTFLNRPLFTLCCIADGRKKNKDCLAIYRQYTIMQIKDKHKRGRGVQQTVEHMEATSIYRDNNRWTGLCEVIWTCSRPMKYKSTDNNQTNEVCSLSHGCISRMSPSAKRVWKQQLEHFSQTHVLCMCIYVCPQSSFVELLCSDHKGTDNKTCVPWRRCFDLSV